MKITIYHWSTTHRQYGNPENGSTILLDVNLFCNGNHNDPGFP